MARSAPSQAVVQQNPMHSDAPAPTAPAAPIRTDVHAVFHALGDPTRQRIIEKLAVGPASVSQLAKPLGITLAAVVQHLQILEESGLVVTEKQGRVRTCRINRTGLAVAARWIAARWSLWERRINRIVDPVSKPNNPQPSGAAATQRGPGNDAA